MTMTRPMAFLFVATLLLACVSGAGGAPGKPELKLFINEIEPSVMSAPQYCTLVYADRSFHYEKADIKRGQDKDRKVYEGQLSEAEWNALVSVIDSPDFRALNVPRTVPPLVMQDTHPYTISVARENKFQSMEFMDSKSMKPYEAQIKPLLKWWKSFRGDHSSEQSGSPDPKCHLDMTHSVYAQ